MIWGDNGSGKTSVLEAIHILSYGKSFKSGGFNTIGVRQILLDAAVGAGGDPSLIFTQDSYDKETNKKDFFGYGGKSEFFGHSFEIQKKRISKGLQIFKSEGIKIRSFFAPNHTYDKNTFVALPLTVPKPAVILSKVLPVYFVWKTIPILALLICLPILEFT
mgnify:CR=1 FL=1